MEVFPNDDKPSFIDVRDLNFSAEEIHASLYSASYSHLAGLASGTPDSVKDVVEGDDVVLQCRFSPALADSSATLYWIRWPTLITRNSLWKPNWIWHSLKNSSMYVCQCRSVNLSILRNINDQHDNVAIGETPFSTGYTWVTTLHKVIIVLKNNRHQPSYLVIHKTTASKLDGHWYLHWIFVILVAFKWVACPSIAFVARPFLYWWGAGHRQKPEDISWHRHSCRQRPRWGAGLQASGKVPAIKREMVGVQQLRVLCFLC